MKRVNVDEHSATRLLETLANTAWSLAYRHPILNLIGPRDPEITCPLL